MENGACIPFSLSMDNLSCFCHLTAFAKIHFKKIKKSNLISFQYWKVLEVGLTSAQQKFSLCVHRFHGAFRSVCLIVYVQDCMVYLEVYAMIVCRISGCS